MFVGHLAVALGAKRLEPRIPLATTVAAAYFLDLLWPLLLLLGLESVRIDPGNTAFTKLDFVSYPWSHSLVLALAWSAAAALLGRAMFRRARAAWILGALVFSHWLLDFVTHRPDLPLWPTGPRVGLDLWDSIPGTLLVEGGLLAAGVAIYLRAHPAGLRRLVFGALILVTGLIWATQPWSPPPPGARAVALGGLVLWLLPPWAHWAEGPRTDAAPSRSRVG